MKKLLTALSLSVIAFGSSSAMAELRLGIDSAPYAPFYEADTNGNFVGWEIEIGDAICAAMEEECTWVPVAWDGIIPALLAKKIDAIVGSMSITEERMKTISFSDKYYNTPASIVAMKSMDMDGTPESVAGKIIGVQVSTTHQNYVQSHFEDVADSVKVYQDFNEHNQDLLAGRVDMVVADSLAMSDFLNSPEGQDFEIKADLADDAIFGPGVGAGIRQEDTELVEKFNAAIQQIRDDGSYAEISAKYFDFDIYGAQ